ncbi:MAG: peptidoglycan DD-metalloendopeptidase family protein [Desulfovibrionaceae bacterium]|jgi:septal ring factor EnvC (AmiA/AmiB activator)|uniref:murein hydrolase activator EnvC family protein n=1 Tax=Desulfovibrio aminophilus TaxID=81425 RepID=UPI00040A40A7|nr:peptidoglycan DD-metalloendopeptidase family protein [Desulfovibrio aminophilus]MDY0307286.1 peptidoglycan DD-metalloendopeptidase family protein [Desulfovibrionaceae bacterium]
MSRRALLALLCLFLSLQPALAQEVNEDLRGREEQAARTREEVARLAAREKDLSGRIAAIEGRVRSAEKEIAARERKLEAIRAEERKTREEHAMLSARKAAIVADLKRLLQGVWPVHVKNLQSRFQGLSSWEALDRRFTWMSHVYAATRDKLEEARQAQLRIAANLERQKRLASEAEAQLAQVNKAKDALLRERLELRRVLAQVRDERRDLETELAAILQTIKELRYQEGPVGGRRIEGFKGRLPWPAKGATVARFDASARPPRNGLGLSLPEGAPVRAVFWGKVMHNDVLRGFGRVVILYHGGDYYSLYAFLADSDLRPGQEVEKDETVGSAGYYPDAKGPGLYFELRFHQKPINPDAWLNAAP